MTSLPKSKVLEAKVESEPSEIKSAQGIVERSQEVQKPIPEEGLKIPEIKTFGEYVSVLCLPNKRTNIVMPGASDYSSNGVVVGVGKESGDEFETGETVRFNEKVIVTEVRDLPDSYEGRKVILLHRKNIFYALNERENVEVCSSKSKCCGGSCH